MLFPTTDGSFSSSSKRPFLPPIQASSDAIQLEIFFVERPADDPLISTAIWQDVDKLGDLSSETRENLQTNGFRIARISSNPPPSVQKLLGMVAEIPSSSDDSKRLLGRHHFLSPGIETEIATGIDRDDCDFQFRDKEGTRNLQYERVNCVFRTKAHRLQDGWVRVDFQPEIHHGDKQLRTTVTDAGPGLRSSKNIDPLMGQRFSVTMNVGETVLVTSTKDDDGSLGDRFFCYEIGDTNDQRMLKKQRLLLIKIVNSGQTSTAGTR